MLSGGSQCNDARVINKTPRCARTSVGFLFHDPPRYSHKREASASRYANTGQDCESAQHGTIRRASCYIVMIRPVSAFTLCEIEITVLPSEALFSACSTSSSVCASRFAVISSSNRSFGFATAALAMDKSCHCPWEKISGVHGVS